MTEFEKQAFLQLLAEQQARQDAKFEAEYDAEIAGENAEIAAGENEAARQERLQWAQNRRKQQS
jgi:hypothetical protein